MTLQQFPVGRTLSDVAALLNATPFRLVQDLPEGLHLHAATKAQLGALQLDPCPIWACDRVDFYTDGSFNENSAWSLVALGRKCDNIVSVSWVGDEVCVDAGSAGWLGASSHGALQAETSAIIMFLWWSCSAGLPADVRLFSDCLCAIKRSEGAWHFGAEDKLATTCRSLFQAVQELGVLNWENVAHVKGHSGDAWNELADCLAKFVLDRGDGLEVAGDIGTWVRSGDIVHLWMLVAASREPLLWPRHVGTHMVDTPVSFGQEEISLYPGTVDNRPTKGLSARGRKTWQCLRLVTLNVQTLASGQGEGAQHFEGRAGYLRDQFEHLGVHIVALQETRTNRAECFLSGNFVRLCSGAGSGGHLGVEAWFARKRDADSLGFSPDELTVVFWDPRCLCVRVKSPLLVAVIAVIHAPTAQDKERNQWWKDLRSRLRRVSTGLPVCVIGDFNTRFDKEVHTRIGGFVWPSKYPVPPDLYQILAEQDLWLPATFEGVHA